MVAAKQYRLAILKALGAQCVKCGYSHPAALQVDHVHGDGAEERKAHGSGVYKHIFLNLSTGRYQILCANCNVQKAVENCEGTKRINPDDIPWMVPYEFELGVEDGSEEDP